jgi:hypothetical protein
MEHSLRPKCREIKLLDPGLMRQLFRGMPSTKAVVSNAAQHFVNFVKTRWGEPQKLSFASLSRRTQGFLDYHLRSLTLE